MPLAIFVAMDWNQTEISLLLQDYFSMLTQELKQEKFNKSEFRRGLLKKLPDRTKGAVEFKHQNVSAVLAKSGLPYIKGYVPLYNIQQVLADAVADFLDRNKWLEQEFELFSTQGVEGDTSKKLDFNKVQVSAPKVQVEEKANKVKVRSVFKRNYLELEQQNQFIGNLGEKFALDYEIWRLKKSKNPALAKKVEWVAQYDDGAGFDILSKREDGSDMYIEVKSTKLGKESPFFFSKSENEFSEQNSSNFHLYRVFSLNQKPQLFIKQGSFRDFCSVEPITFKGSF